MLKEWLIEEGIFRKEIEDEKSEFRYLVEFPSGSGQVCEVLKPKGKDFVLVVGGIVLAEKHYKALHSMDRRKKMELIHKWKMDLLFREVEFRMIPDAENLERIEFQGVIYDEELTKPKLMRMLREVFRCKLYIIWNAKYELERDELEPMYL